jgi:ribonucleoside-diphosphate reductase alpha chain
MTDPPGRRFPLRSSTSKRPTDRRGKTVDSSVSRPHSEDPTAAATASSGRRNGRRRGAPATTKLEATGLRVARRFTRDGVHPYDEVTWEKRTAAIANEKGETVFEQTDCEVPSFWSQMATNVVVSKYFRGPLGTPRRETSVKQVISRVVDTIAQWGRDGGYFATEADAQAFQDELCHLILHQKMSFNSPVWFNIGVPGSKNQASACFIQSVDDTMDSILTLAKNEGMLFKYGSGTGTNLSAIRSSSESLAGGGTASGPVSFMKGFDAFAGVIKSGGTTRRAAKMVILNADHPDVEEFITCKVSEERKAWTLIEGGYDSSFTGEAYASVFFQNSNNSVRVTDEFMRAVAEDRDWHLYAVTDRNRIVKTVKARELMRLMAESAWQCGDPGIQYDTTINDWHTSANTGRINASNPCSEYMYLDDTACNLASINLTRFLNDDGTIDIDAYRHAIHITITAQEILVSNASYPTEKIAKNSEDFRPLGLGYANLGALLMARGAPYDSPQGRDLAACLTAILTGEAYAQSARVAREIGPFKGYAVNRKPMLRVIGKHREAAYNIPAEGIEPELIAAARHAWDEAHELGARHGYRNAQATVLAPTGCLTPDSLVMTSRGLVRLRSLGNPNGAQWQDIDVDVATHEGPKKATKFFVNGVEPVVSVSTKRGYRIRGTTGHRIKVVDKNGDWQWRRMADVRKGDRVPLMLGGLIGEPVPVHLPPLPDAYWTADHETTAPRYVTPQLAELIGYFMGDGSLHSKELRFCVSPQDMDLAEHLASLGRELFSLQPRITKKRAYIEVGFTSVRLVMWWEACGFAKLTASESHKGKGWLARVPDAVLHTNNPAAYGAFVRGLFEADGTVSSGYPSFTTTTESLARDVQSILLALGFITTLEVQPPGKGGWGSRTKYRLRLLNVRAAARFASEIGFASARKDALCQAIEYQQSERYDHVPLSRQMIDRLAPTNDRLRKVLLMEHKRGAVTRRIATELLERAPDPELAHVLDFFYDDIADVSLSDEDLTLDLSVPDNVSYVANGFVSHNTISFMLDCDTTGVEPDIALVKYKKLVGGGMLKIVNQTVPAALRRLGYGDTAIADIVAYIDANDTIEGAPQLREEDVAVFDCAFTPQHGSRSITWQGHLRMMAAVQPFISGALSKTVNLPNDSTVEDIERAYIDGWKLGLKAVAIYRDGSKRSQPLATSIDKTTGQRVQVVERPLRRRLPSERQALTHRFEVSGHEGYITVGLYEDGTPGEIFLKMAKEGSTVSGLMDSFATAISLALQYGVPLQALVDKFSHTRFEPQGFTKNPEIPIAKSVMDYIFRWLASRFLSVEERDRLGIIRRDEDGEPVEAPTLKTPLPMASAATTSAPATTTLEAPGAFINQADAPTCSECGSLMVRNGACYKCFNCGATSGCS